MKITGADDSATKVAFFSSHNLWPSHYETELELMQKHLDHGHDIVQMSCFSELKACDQNLTNAVDTCFLCCKKRKLGVDLLDSKVRNVGIKEYLHWEDKKVVEALRKYFKDINDLKAYSIDERYDIGQSVASSLISLLRVSSLDLQEHRELVKDYMVGSAEIYYAFKRFLAVEQPALVYLFNGRWAHTRAVFRACQRAGVRCVLHERGQDIHHYGLFTNHFPHSIENFTTKAKELWERSDKSEKIESAESFFKSRRVGANVDWYSFIDKQDTNQLPEGWDDTKVNIVIFNSSEDEVAAIDDEWKNHLYDSQLEGIRAICKDLLSRSDIKLYLRLHPNLANADPSETNAYSALSYANLTVISPESKISSYLLIEKADKVVTFGSTVGIEATFWNKPSILAGKAFYEKLESTYNPNSHSQLIAYCKQKDLASLEKRGALIYGYYFRSFGSKYKYVKANSFSSVEFRETNLDQVVQHDSVKIKRFFKIRTFARILKRPFLKVNLLKLLYK
ncbi:MULTISPECIES: hypothetical protein [unclassified Imperialibacter]|uniref:hypothetical protein n=1 Tax=unclassified Imperialibacter TaxID=2629706 RepID=UPI001257FBC8|nr:MULTISPECIES: hypothetical protein [unclassified Imperialibacter]CAD5268106.1 conserved hypothetical protein [Imperialibacter sp. 89]CAD5296581.1 conserved hypothetical protein [Imperialibacter sp. 75]VVT33827.1 conserved hypothetical protein [Imperialibacter sp. EC-SDR9]